MLLFINSLLNVRPRAMINEASVCYLRFPLSERVVYGNLKSRVALVQ